jgi:alpha-1,2-glucosyltransferase
MSAIRDKSTDDGKARWMANHGLDLQRSSSNPGGVGAEGPRGNLARGFERAARPYLRILALAFVISQSVWVFSATRDMGRYSDEDFHVPQVQRFCKGKYKLDRDITMLPGYHAFAAALGRVAHDCSARTLRGINVAIGVLIFWVALRILETLRSKYALSRALSLNFLPILFLFEFVAYTDALAILFALGAMLLMLRRRWLIAGVVASLGVLVRQTNVVVLAFMVVVLWFERARYGSWSEQLRVFLSRAWPCLLGLGAFGVFVLVNRGVAIGDRGQHAAGLHVGNLYFALFLLAIVALPTGLSALRDKREPLSRSALFTVTLFASYVVYIVAFKVDHTYNSVPGFLRNELLAWVMHSPLTRSLFFVPIAFGLASVWATGFARAAHRAWLPIAAVMLMPESLIEHRYAILPIAFWMVLRKDSSARAEVLNFIVNFSLSMLLMWIILSGDYWL